ncbi:hypothetical protein RGQ13_14590 [Thalassotalea psychrophila]|uniref:4Fe-4S ferredoxin-type domain-containing protein n=1 Tax=Thalassotalea psychrophila TaxID=3065647 RepID=A0ABY9TRA4_9GAMM|nr:hypothetical protein RGQ13_14590 [Colwelliaceae bacterium SQ149]
MSFAKVSVLKLSMPSLAWKIVQTILWLIGVIIVSLLLFKPDLGILLFWNLLIPIAPAIVVIIPGVWRNICPMSSSALLLTKLGLSQQKKISIHNTGKLFSAGVVALILIVPLRHLLLNTSGPSTAVMLLIATAIAIVMGYKYQWRSGWCASLCPIHSVERLYGSTPAFTTDNAHCTTCEKCTSICPDSTRQMSAAITRNVSMEKLSGLVMTGGFVGYIWGWYHVPDYVEVGFWQVVTAYALPLGAGLISLAIYLLLRKLLAPAAIRDVNKVFATSAVICYYWYRLPSLVGMGLYPDDGVLINLSDTLPGWFPIVLKLASALFFVWFMLFRNLNRQKRSWSTRPEYAIKVSNI